MTGLVSRLRSCPRAEPDVDRDSAAASSSSGCFVVSLPARLIEVRLVSRGDAVDLALTLLRLPFICLTPDSSDLGCCLESNFASRQFRAIPHAQPPKLASVLLMHTDAAASVVLAAASVTLSPDSCFTTPFDDAGNSESGDPDKEGSTYHIMVISELGGMCSFATKQKWYSTSLVMNIFMVTLGLHDRRV